MTGAADHKLSVTHEGRVALITLERPPSNFVSVPLMRELADAIDAVDADPGLTAMVLQTEGKSFCAGADFSASNNPIAEVVEGVPELYLQALRIYGAQKPIVAAIQGAAVGAGLGLALAADFRVVSPEARFVANFVKLAFHPGFGISLALPRLIGEQKAALMLLTGRRIKGDEALAWGLADQLVETEKLRPAALALAQEIAEGGPLAVVATRKTLRGELADAIRERTIHEFRVQSALRETEDFAEGVRAVAERRPGRFVGR
jgi:enoyl-CoA hydratase/carnithine racemase